LLPSSALSSAQVFTAYPEITMLDNRTFHLLFKPDILTCYEHSTTKPRTPIAVSFRMARHHPSKTAVTSVSWVFQPNSTQAKADSQCETLESLRPHHALPE